MFIQKKFAYLNLSIWFLIVICSACASQSDDTIKKNFVLLANDLERLSETDSLRPLSLAEVLAWSKDIIELDTAKQFKYLIESMQKIDSLKKGKHYDSYLKTIDIGMVTDSKAFLIDTVLFSNDSLCLIWALGHKSYEACPYFTETKAVASLFVKKQLKKAVEIANVENWADAPFFTTLKTDARLKGNKAFIQQTTINGDEAKTDSSTIKLERTIF
jgi:hypothetical protein